MIKTLTINLVVFVVAFFALEGVVRLFVPVRNVGPAFSEYDPVYGKRMKANFSTVRTSPEFQMKFSTNSHRHRGPEPSGAVTGGVLMLGDSYTEGYGVSDGEEYAALLREELRRRHGATAPPVLNTGMSDTGNGRSLKMLQREGKALAPRLVVLQLMNNDFGDNRRENFFALRNGELQEVSGPAAGRPSPWSVHQIVETVPGLARSYAISAIRQMRWSSSARGFYEDTTSSDELTYRIWDRIFHKCREERWPLVLLAVDLRKDRLERLKAIAAERQLPLVVSPTRAERPEFFFEIDGHWNQRGHRSVAEMLIKAIDDASVSMPGRLRYW